MARRQICLARLWAGSGLFLPADSMCLVLFIPVGRSGTWPYQCFVECRVLGTDGAVFALVLNKAPFTSKAEARRNKWQELVKGLTIIRTEPKVALGGIVRIINTTAQFAFPVFLPTYMAAHGFSTTDWLYIWGTIFTSNIAFNLIFGFVGDRFGWRQTITWFGGVGCGFTTLLLFYYSSIFRMAVFGLAMISGYRLGCLPGWLCAAVCTGTFSW